MKEILKSPLEETSGPMKKEKQRSHTAEKRRPVNNKIATIAAAQD
jgi:hypothetical protein